VIEDIEKEKILSKVELVEELETVTKRFTITQNSYKFLKKMAILLQAPEKFSTVFQNKSHKQKYGDLLQNSQGKT